VPWWGWWGLACLAVWLLYMIYDRLQAIHSVLLDATHEMRNRERNEELARLAADLPD
jgi:hypothetical protein